MHNTATTSATARALLIVRSPLACVVRKRASSASARRPQARVVRKRASSASARNSRLSAETDAQDAILSVKVVSHACAAPQHSTRFVQCATYSIGSIFALILEIAKSRVFQPGLAIVRHAITVASVGAPVAVRLFRDHENGRPGRCGPVRGRATALP
jgi:hypothetical protein